MLHLTAMEGDYLMIGDDIKLMFLKQNTSGLHQIHVGVVAPKSITILRDRIYEQKLSDRANDPELPREEALKAKRRLRDYKKERMESRSELLRRMSKFNYDESRRLAKKEAMNSKNEEQEVEATC